MKSIARTLHVESSGQAMTEFIIVFPPLFLLFLVIIQTALLMTAKQVVEYSAFCAARGAIVYDGSADKAKRAANIACMPISPKVTFETMQEFKDFALGLGSSVVDMADYIGDYPELAGIVLAWEDIPGIDVLNKIRKINLNDIFSIDNLKLAAGLELLDLLCGANQRIPLRYPSSALLTDQEIATNGNDITIKIKHNYAMRVPVVNKIFFFMYIYGKVRNEIRNRFANLPDEVVRAICSRALGAIGSLASSGGNNSLYFLPISGDCTLTVEKNAPNVNLCD